MRFTEAEVERAARSGTVDVRAATTELGGWPALIGLAMSFGTEAAREFAREEVLDALDRPRQRALAGVGDDRWGRPRALRGGGRVGRRFGTRASTR